MAKSKFEKYLVRKPVYKTARGIKNRQSPTMTYVSKAQIQEADCDLEFGWIFGIPEPNPPTSQHVHTNDEIILHFGADPQHPEDLGGEIEICVGGQPLTFAMGTALFVPNGIKHGPITWKKFYRPHIEMTLSLGSGNLIKDRPNTRIPGPHKESTLTVDYEKYLVRKPIYERARGIKNRQSPTMTYMSKAQIPEADYYIEFGWIYGIPEPNPPVSRHVHGNDEIILHFGGDPQNPEDLGGEIEVMVEDEPLIFDTSTALFIPKGVTHCPVTWKKWTKPHIEMAITLGSGVR